jgi:hypothetical protein
LQEKAAGRKLLLIAVTGYGHEEDRRRSREAGIHLHLLKPVEPEELRTLLAGFKTIIGERTAPDALPRGRQRAGRSWPLPGMICAALRRGRCPGFLLYNSDVRLYGYGWWGFPGAGEDARQSRTAFGGQGWPGFFIGPWPAFG